MKDAMKDVFIDAMKDAEFIDIVILSKYHHGNINLDPSWSNIQTKFVWFQSPKKDFTFISQPAF